MRHHPSLNTTFWEALLIDNKYISIALNASVSNLHGDKSAVCVQLKPSKLRNLRHQEKARDGWVKGQGQSVKYMTNYTLHDSLSLSPSLPPSRPPLSPSLSPSPSLPSPSLPIPPLSPLSLPHSISPPITHSPSLSQTDQQHRQQQSMKRKQTKTKVFQGIKVGQRRQRLSRRFYEKFWTVRGNRCVGCGEEGGFSQGALELSWFCLDQPLTTDHSILKITFCRVVTQGVQCKTLFSKKPPQSLWHWGKDCAANTRFFCKRLFVFACCCCCCCFCLQPLCDSRYLIISFCQSLPRIFT